MRLKKADPDLLAERLELPREAAGALLVTAIGNERVLIENHRGILQFGDVCIRLRAREGAFSLCGEKLRIRLLGRHTMAIEGDIRSMEWEK